MLILGPDEGTHRPLGTFKFLRSKILFKRRFPSYKAIFPGGPLALCLVCQGVNPALFEAFKGRKLSPAAPDTCEGRFRNVTPKYVTKREFK